MGLHDFNGKQDGRERSGILRSLVRSGRLAAAFLAVALAVSVGAALAGYTPADALRSQARATVTPPSGKAKSKCVTKKQKKTKYCKAKAQKAKVKKCQNKKFKKTHARYCRGVKQKKSRK
jgi:hypothetical protein